MKTVMIPLAQIAPCPRNVRQEMDEDELAQLAANVKLRGVLVPVKVRPNRSWKIDKRPLVQGKGFGIYAALEGGSAQATLSEHKTLQQARAALPKYELVYGHRRLEAARKAKLKEIPAVIADLDDRQTLEEQLIENGQRADMTPLDQAEGYDRLMKEHGVKIDEVAKRMSCSASSARNLLKLLQLPERGQRALRNGELSPSAAALIARLPGEIAKQQAISYATTPSGRGGPPSIQDLRAWIAQEQRVELKMAPFPQDKKDVAPNTPSCKECPKRVGNLQKADPEAFEGVRADVCTDPICYRQKIGYHGRALLNQKRAEGHKTLEPEISRYFFDHLGALKTSVRYYMPSVFDSIHAALAPNKTALEVFRAELPKEAWVYTVSTTGQLYEMLDQDPVDDYLAKKGLFVPAEGPIRARKAQEEDAAAPGKADKEAQRLLAQRAIEHAATVSAKWVKGLDAFPPALTKLLRAALQHCLADGHGPAVKAVLQAHMKRTTFPPDLQLNTLRELLRTGDPVKLFPLLAEYLAAEQIVGKGLTVDPGTFEDTLGFKVTEELAKAKQAQAEDARMKEANRAKP